MKIGKYNESLVEEQPLGNHLGIAIGFYSKALAVVDQYAKMKPKKIAKIFAP